MGKKCKSMTELSKIPNQNDMQRDPYNCAKLNAAMDKNGVRTPYFDAGLVKMNKGGAFSYMSTRNNNFSNRNQVGFMCVKDGNTGQCPADGGCQPAVEAELLKRFKSEDPAGKSKELLLELEGPNGEGAKAKELLAQIMELPKAER